MDTALTVKLTILGLMGTIYLLLNRQVMRITPDQPFHVALHQRDLRRARFYQRSVWVGLAAAFLSFITLEALSGLRFHSIMTRDLVRNTLHGVGLWGLMIVALVWSQVGQRIVTILSETQSLRALSEEESPRRS
ncbi:MAG: hypothetical protein RMJ43_04445 [Chloroherpetonaceae bacterium]|nr:hypothetical protein [Chthonomonadaceae bacterium]MDW8207063.1 hypothetical protein [Chloroherpetonaceae bacterium]